MPQLRTKHLMRVACVVFVCLLWSASAFGATRTWSGGGGDNNWTTAGNWGGTAPVAGDDLVFPSGAARLSNNNNIAAGTSFNSITISGSGYTLAGNSIALGAGNLSDTNAAGSNTISLAISMSATRTFSISNAAETLTISGVISGAGGLTRSGSGMLILSGANTYTGLTTVNAGVLNIRNAQGTGTTAGGVTVASGAALQLQGGIAVGAEALTLNGTGISNDGALRNISGTNSWSGTITLGAGGARINSDAGTLTLSGGTTGATQPLTVGGTGNLTISGVIGTTSGSLTKDGAGTVTLNAASTYTGATTINGGTLSVSSLTNGGSSSSIGQSSNAAANLVINGGTLQYTGGGDSTDRLFTVGTSGGTIDASGSAALTFTNTGSIALSGSNTARTITLTGTNANSNTLTPVIGDNGTGATALTKAGTGRWVLSGVNTYTGATGINAGTLRLGATNAVGASSAVTVAAGATFDLRGFSDTIGSLAGAGTVTTGAGGAVTLTAGGDNTSTTFSGVIQDGGSGPLALTKQGTGTLTLSNASNSYTGITTINAGTVSITTGTNLGTAPGSPVANQITINGGTLATTGTFTISTNRGITLGASGGTIDVASGTTLTAPNLITGSGSLTKTSTGTLVLSNASNSYTGITTINAGTVSITTGTNLGTAPGSPVANQITINGGTLATTGTFTISTNRGITLGASGGTIDVASGTTLTAPNLITGSGSLTKTNTGTLVLSNASNSYTGITTINAGTVSITTGTNLGTAPGSPVANQITINGGTLATTGTFTISTNRGITLGASGGTIDVASGTTLTAPNLITGSGSLTKTSAGTLTLSGANTYTGTTTVSAGTLLVNGSTSSSSAVTVSSGATLGGTGTVAGALTISSGAILAPGDSSASTLSTGALTLNNTTALNYELGTASDLTSVAGNLTLDGTLNVTAGAGFGVGTYRLFDYTGTLTNNTLVTGTMPAGFAYAISISTAGQVNLIVVPGYDISGTVFEDVNYGGGAGRSLAAASGTARSNARVELYDASGNFVSSTTTNASGLYTFNNLIAANYTVRIVNSTVTSSRPGYVSGNLAVQTFRTDASSGTTAADTDRVGGEEPSKVDAASNTTSATLASLTTATVTPQSITPVTVNTANVTGADFGFNFDTVVNTLNSGQGSLREAIDNSTGLGNAGLAQVGQPAGWEAIIFMIPDGNAHPGLRSGILNQLTSGVANITVLSDLPALAANTIIDGGLQTNFVGNTNPATLGTGGTVGTDGLVLPTVNGPEIQITKGGSATEGLRLEANNIVIRNLAIYGFGNGLEDTGDIRVAGDWTNRVIEDCVIGTPATSFSDPGASRTNGSGIYLLEGLATIRNNLIGYHNLPGIFISTDVDGATVTGNEVRGNGISNNSFAAGIYFEDSGGDAHTVQGNLIADSKGHGIDVTDGGTDTIVNNTITNNGVSGTRTAGVKLTADNNTIDRNVIYANTGAGVMAASVSTGNRITMNSIYANGPTSGQIGIDLLSSANNQNAGTSPFVTINDSGDGDAGGNGLFNAPVLTYANISGGNLILKGYARPGSAIELFIAEADGSGFGEGKTYLVTLTEGSGSDTDATTGTYTSPVNGLNVGTDTTNRFRFVIPVPAGVSLASVLTATATVGSNTSEFSGNITVTSNLAYSISGTVFEDMHYGGGAGRTLAASSGAVRSGARVELYDASGNFIGSTATDASGAYTLLDATDGSYTVRVVNSTVTSSRAGYVSTLIPVQTFRTDASSGSAVDDTDRVGGEVPTKADAASNTTNATLASLTTGTTTAQSITPVTVSSAVITGVDFGFNFDTIVNTNNTGQGSLRQFITNSNALGNGGLAQAGLTAGVETSIFMISDGAAHPGLRAGLANQLTGGVANIALTSLLPQITAASTAIDGSTQTTNVGNTNSGTLGIGGTVGVDGLSLQTVNRPEVQIVDNGGLAIGLDVQANSVTVRGLAIYGFGTIANNDSHANIRIGNNFTGTLIEQNVLGASATSFTDPGAGARSVGDNIRSAGADSGTVRNNLIGFSAGKGIQLGTASTGWLIEGNEVRGNGIGNSNLDGIDIESSGGNTVRGNLFSGNEAPGIDMYQGSGANTVQNNTVTGNGVGPGANVETPGVRVYGAGNTIDRNIINANFGAGVMVTSGSTGNTITKNSIYGNGQTSNQIGIDLLSATNNASTGTAPFVTVNDSGDGDSGGNNLLNYPVLLTAIALGGNLTLTGYARPGSAIELYIAESDPSGFGEGKTYLVTLTEGSGSDTDATTGTYTNPVNGLNQGTDTTNKYSFTIPIPGGVSVGTILTATATLSGNTSEFSGNVTVTAAPDLTIAKSHSGNFTQGQIGAIYSITATNSGSAATSGLVTVTDTLPAELTATAISGTGWSCVLGTLTCTRSDALAVGASYPAITLTVDVALTAPNSVTNSATVSGGGEVNVANNTANDPTTINPAAPPTVALVKSVIPNGPQVPGTDLAYTIVYTNNGGQPATSFVIVDPDMLNADPLERVFHNVDFKVGSMTSAPGTTGLVATFEYSNDGGTTWTYTPVSGGGSAPADYDRNVTNVRWVFAGSLSHLAPNNSGSVDFVVRIP